MPPQTPNPPRSNARAISNTFLLIVVLIVGIFNSKPATPPEEMAQDKFIGMVEAGQIVSTSGQPLQRMTDKTTGQRYLLGVYYVNYSGASKHATGIDFRVPVSADPNDKAMSAVRKANMLVIDSSEMLKLSPAMRRYLLIGLVAMLLPFWIWMVLREGRRSGHFP